MDNEKIHTVKNIDNLTNAIRSEYLKNKTYFYVKSAGDFFLVSRVPKEGFLCVIPTKKSEIKKQLKRIKKHGI